MVAIDLLFCKGLTNLYWAILHDNTWHQLLKFFPTLLDKIVKIIQPLCEKKLLSLFAKNVSKVHKWSNDLQLLTYKLWSHPVVICTPHNKVYGYIAQTAFSRILSSRTISYLMWPTDLHLLTSKSMRRVIKAICVGRSIAKAETIIYDLIFDKFTSLEIKVLEINERQRDWDEDERKES